MADLPGDARLVELEDGGVLNVVELGSPKAYPLMGRDHLDGDERAARRGDVGVADRPHAEVDR